MINQQTFSTPHLLSPYPKEAFTFTWKYCGHCEVMMVICPMCGNNSCNAGFGYVTNDFKPVHGLDYWDNEKRGLRDGFKSCPVCNLAYEYQRMARKTKTTPLPSKIDLDFAKRDRLKEKDFFSLEIK